MKKVILIVPVLIVVIALFIPATQEETITVNSSFFNVYRVLSTPVKWKEWRQDLRKIPAADTAKIVIKKDTSFFKINYPELELKVNIKDGVFTIDDHSNNKNTHYIFLAIPAKAPNTTLITVDKKVNLIGYLFQKLDAATFADTHIGELKSFMETDSLKYGCTIFKTHVPEANLIVMGKVVPTKTKYADGMLILSQLQQFVQTHHLKQTQPLIAQYIPKPNTDSTTVKIGFFVDKETVSENGVVFTRMPKGGPLYSAKYSGRFDRRLKIYSSLQQYFTDHLYQQAILPFESFLDNKLPTSDSSHVNVQVNFSTYF